MATLTKLVVFGVYPTREDAQVALGQITRAGFRSADVTVLLPDNRDSRQFAQENGTLVPKEIQTGVNADVELKGNLGLTQPMRGPVQGALPGALREMRLPEDEAEQYGDRVKQGEVLVSVNCNSAGDANRAREVLAITGAALISSN
ncbi:MAG TPA: hypothetical protein VGL72_12350 [Bryobacteraceae bacterium]|jgi:hypothetical protein